MRKNDFNLDNQNCLCGKKTGSAKMEKVLSDFRKTAQALEISPALFLNRTSSANVAKKLDVMIVPEGVEKIFYFIGLTDSFIKELYLPSTVKSIKIWTATKFTQKRKGLKVHVAGDNPYFVEEKGDIYTRDSSALVYSNIHVESNKTNSVETPATDAVTKSKDKVVKSSGKSSSKAKNDKKPSVQSVKDRIADRKVYWCTNGPLDKEIFFNDRLVYIDNEYNKKQDEYIPQFVLPENKSLLEDHGTVDWQGIPIDCKIANVIKLLNDKGFKTAFSCSGHLLKSDYYSVLENGKQVRVANIFERVPLRHQVHGYISFDKTYPEIEKLFASERKVKFSNKMHSLFHIKQTKTMRFYIQKDEKSYFQCQGTVLRFDYESNENVQNDVMQYLETTFSELSSPSLQIRKSRDLMY